MTEHRSDSREHKPEPDFHGAAIIDANGREIPITESMVQRACAALERAWRFPRRDSSAC